MLSRGVVVEVADAGASRRNEAARGVRAALAAVVLSLALAACDDGAMDAAPAGGEATGAPDAAAFDVSGGGGDREPGVRADGIGNGAAPDAAIAADAAVGIEAEGDGCELPAEPGDHALTLTSGGAPRSARLHVPAGLEPGAPSMLLLVLHGFTSNAAAIETQSGLSAVSDERGFLVAYPQGLGNAWNGGTCCPGAADDDVQLARDLVDAIAARHCVDRARVFAAGISNGGLMANRLACEAADLVAGVAPISAGIGVACMPTRPVAHLAFGGSADPLVPLAITEAEVARWRELNGCGEAPEVFFEQGDARCERFTDCAEGGEVRLCRIEGGGHNWPGGVAVPILGGTSMDLDASRAMVDFFEQVVR